MCFVVLLLFCSLHVRQRSGKWKDDKKMISVPPDYCASYSANINESSIR